MRFWKCEGTGNDFVILRGFDSIDPQQLCDRRFGVGADGVVQIIDRGPNKLEWRFWNNDGSPAEFCGNAARTIAAWAEVNGYTFPIELQTEIGNVTLDRTSSGRPGEFEVARELKRPLLVEERSDLFPNQTDVKGIYWVDTGVPHFVIALQGRTEPLLDRGDTRKFDRLRRNYGEMIEFLRPLPTPKGSNVTFLNQRKDAIEAVSFERGVEDFTLSCGTGVLAVALTVLHHNQAQEGDVRVETLGGPLAVSMGSGRRRILLSGPAKVVFEGQIC